MTKNEQRDRLLVAELSTPSNPAAVALAAAHGVTTMPFSIRNLSVLAYAQGFTLWHFKADKSLLGDIVRPGFFNDAIGMLAAGDMIHVSAADIGATVYIVSTQGNVQVQVMQASAPAAADRAAA